MLPSFGLSWRAAWFVRSRQMRTEFAFWLAVIGYNRRDRSLTQRIYLVYAAIFFSIWGFAVLSLLAGFAVQVLTSLAPHDLPTAATNLGLAAMLGWALLALYRAGRRSPIHFGEEDAALVCQTPLDRRAVALAWFPGGWIASGIPFWAVAVTLGFALIEGQLQGKASFQDIPAYVQSGVRALVPVLFLQMGLLAAIWATGARRLSWGGRRSPIRWVALLLAGLLAVLAWLGIFAGRGWPARALAVVSWPFAFPLRAAAGIFPWPAGLAVAALIASLGLTALAITSKHMLLAMAAQESAGRDAGLAVALPGGDEITRQVTARERLGAAGHARWKGMPGGTALLWK